MVDLIAAYLSDVFLQFQQTPPSFKFLLAAVVLLFVFSLSFLLRSARLARESRRVFEQLSMLNELSKKTNEKVLTLSENATKFERRQEIVISQIMKMKRDMGMDENANTDPQLWRHRDHLAHKARRRRKPPARAPRDVFDDDAYYDESELEPVREERAPRRRRRAKSRRPAPVRDFADMHDDDDDGEIEDALDFDHVEETSHAQRADRDSEFDDGFYADEDVLELGSDHIADPEFQEQLRREEARLMARRKRGRADGSSKRPRKREDTLAADKTRSSVMRRRRR